MQHHLTSLISSNTKLWSLPISEAIPNPIPEAPPVIIHVNFFVAELSLAAAILNLGLSCSAPLTIRVPNAGELPQICDQRFARRDVRLAVALPSRNSGGTSGSIATFLPD